MAKLRHNRHAYSLGSLLPDSSLPASVADILVQSLTRDSRQVQAGSLFFAIVGSQHDGRAFIDKAVAAGAVAVVCTDEEARAGTGLSWRGDVPVIGVRDVAATAGRAADTFYGSPSRSLAVTGITGTNGKSTCAFLLAQLEQRLGRKSAVIGTLGYGSLGGTLRETGMTTPDALDCHRILRELADDQVSAVAMEVSSHGLVQQRTAGIAMDAAVFTNVSRDHLDYHASMADYINAKARLFATRDLRHAVVNLDSEPGATAMIGALRPGAQLWTYAQHNPAAQIVANRPTFLPDGMRALLRTPWGSGELHARLLGDFNLYNLLAVITVVCARGARLEDVLRLLPELQPVKGRMQNIESPASVRAVVDYAHTPDALAQALKALRAHGRGKIHAVFGCGGDRDKGKRPEMARAAETLADRVVITSDNPRGESPEQIIADIRAGLSRPEKVVTQADRAKAIAQTIDAADAGDWVLIAGKGHETYQTVGSQRLPFDDAAQARLALQARASREGVQC